MNASTTRRALLRGAAWTTPAVVLATTTPAYARSTVPVPPKASCVIEAQRIRQPGKSKSRPWVYLVSVACTSKVDFVIINGRPAQKPRSSGSIYTVTLPGHHDTLTVSVATRHGAVSRVVQVR